MLGSKTIAKCPCWPPPCVVSTNAAFPAANSCMVLIFSCVGSTSYLGNIELGNLSMCYSIG